MFFSLSELRIDFIPRPGNNVKSELNKVTQKCHLQPEPPLNQVAMSGYVLGSLHSGECNACTESNQVLFHKRDNKNMIKGVQNIVSIIETTLHKSHGLGTL